MSFFVSKTAKSVFLGSDIFRHSIYGHQHPLNIARVWPVIDLLRSENLLEKAHYKAVPIASIKELSLYHDEGYVRALFQAQTQQSLPDDMRDIYNIGKGANPIFREVYDRPATAAKASMIGAEMLVTGKADYVFNPSGGTHHGQKDKAFGFCFVNDPAIALITMRRLTDKKILYLDIDAHHCDGVQDWLSHDENMRIISIHQQGAWPRTGADEDRGHGYARNYNLAEGAGDAELLSLMRHQIADEIESFKPDYLILQAGADGHKYDPQSRLHYSLQGYWQAIELALGYHLPTLILGGGGYNPYLTAKAWAGIWYLLRNVSPYDKTLNDTSQKLLKGLDWFHRLGRNPPENWFTHLYDHNS